MQPFMFRFRVKQRGQIPSRLNDNCEYDEERDIAVVKADGRPAVLAEEVRPLVTKKADVEKSEDRKDQWM